jgi:hypothetical protein
MEARQLGHPYTSMCVVVVLDRPEGFPDRFVARRHWVHRDDQVTVDPDPLAVAVDLPALRGLLPAGLVRVARAASDPPDVVETWV